MNDSTVKNVFWSRQCVWIMIKANDHKPALNRNMTRKKLIRFFYLNFRSNKLNSKLKWHLRIRWILIDFKMISIDHCCFSHPLPKYITWTITKKNKRLLKRSEKETPIFWSLKTKGDRETLKIHADTDTDVMILTHQYPISFNLAFDLLRFID